MNMALACAHPEPALARALVQCGARAPHMLERIAGSSLVARLAFQRRDRTELAVVAARSAGDAAVNNCCVALRRAEPGRERARLAQHSFHTLTRRFPTLAAWDLHLRQAPVEQNPCLPVPRREFPSEVVVELDKTSTVCGGDAQSPTPRYRGLLRGAIPVLLQRAHCEDLDAQLWELQHPNLLRLLGEAWRDERERYLVAELPSEGVVLAGHHRLTLACIVTLLHDVAKALCFLHSRKLAHGHVRAEHVFADRDFRVFKLAFACELTDFADDHCYQAPEKAGSLPVEDEAAMRDVFSFGVMACELLSTFGDRSWAWWRSLNSAEEDVQVAKELQLLAIPAPLRDLVAICCSRSPRDREDMSFVEDMLSSMRYASLSAPFFLHSCCACACLTGNLLRPLAVERGLLTSVSRIWMIFPMFTTGLR